MEFQEIWGGFPLPNQQEVDDAHQQMSDRYQRSVERQGTGASYPTNRHRLLEFANGDSSLLELLGRFSDSYAQGDSQIKEAYLTGAKDAIEVLGTIALSRSFNRTVSETGLSDLQK